MAQDWSQDKWQEVKSKVEGLGLKLKLHYEQESDDDDDSKEPGDTKAAIEDFGEKLEDAFESFGAAAKDPAVRSDLKDIGALLKDALVDTFSTVGAEVGDNIKKAGDRVSEKAGDRFGKQQDESVQDTVQDTGADDPEPTDS